MYLVASSAIVCKNVGDWKFLAQCLPVSEKRNFRNFLAEFFCEAIRFRKILVKG